MLLGIDEFWVLGIEYLDEGFPDIFKPLLVWFTDIGDAILVLFFLLGFSVFKL